MDCGLWMVDGGVTAGWPARQMHEVTLVGDKPLLLDEDFKASSKIQVQNHLYNKCVVVDGGGGRERERESSRETETRESPESLLRSWSYRGLQRSAAAMSRVPFSLCPAAMHRAQQVECFLVPLQC